jgi:hypothetical protein
MNSTNRDDLDQPGTHPHTAEAPPPGADASDQDIDVAGTEADPKAMASLHHARTAAARCEVCGNVYDKTIRVEMNGHTHVFDCFECAIHRLAPACAHCGCRIIGHGVEADGRFYCCDNCVRLVGASAAMRHA